MIVHYQTPITAIKAKSVSTTAGPNLAASLDADAVPLALDPVVEAAPPAVPDAEMDAVASAATAPDVELGVTVLTATAAEVELPLAVALPD